MRNRMFTLAALTCSGLMAASSVSLDGEWSLDYFPQPIHGAVRMLPLSVPYKTVKAVVPGNCELDLVNAGVLPPLEIGLNVMQARKYEGYQWLYSRTFMAPNVGDDQRVMLVFDGIDTLADIFMNGEKIGETDNMLIPHSFNVTKLLKKGENTVQVLLRSAFLESQEKTVGAMCYHMGFADNVPFRKAAHMGGWDIFPRLYASGLWRGVRLDVEDPVRIGNVAWVTGGYSRSGGKNRCSMRAMFRVQGPMSAFLDGSQIRLSVSSGGKSVASAVRPLQSVQNQIGMGAADFALWWPKGAGEPALYTAAIEIVSQAGVVLARDVRRIGFRTVELLRDDVYGPERPGQFLFKVNGEPIYVRGSNWVPLDSLHGRDMTHLIPTLEMFDDLNCNMVRVWGGGVYEPKEFFDFCDEHGIMVWQDFMTGCSAFPQSDDYAKATEREVREIVLKYRNRASLAIWSGNNENDEAFRWKLGGLARDPNRDRNSRTTIPNVLFEFDVTRPYLPSSPYRSPDVVKEVAKPSEDHLWGPRAYYKTNYYTNSPCWFASEMGYHGMPNRELLERVMTKGCVYPWKGSPAPFEKDHKKLEWNDEWLIKASNPLMRRDSGLMRRNDLMTNQVRLMFGGVDTDLDTFIAQSQFVQAEAMKTFCELFRSRKFTRFNGLIWWNVRDGWPIISDAVVDYYGGKKPAYYALKNAQRDQIVCVVDDHTAWAVNDARRPVKGRAVFTDAETGERRLAVDDFEIPANGKLSLGSVPFEGQGVVLIDAVLDGQPFKSHFLYGEPPFNWRSICRWLRN